MIPAMIVRNVTKNLVLVAIIISFAPISTFLLAANYFYLCCFPRSSVRRRLRKTPGFEPKTILLSGINTPQGLCLARAFYDTGHNVIGVDGEPGGIPVPPRFSKTVHKFYVLNMTLADGMTNEYVRRLTETIENEGVDLWVNCATGANPSLEAQVKAKIEQTTKCRCFALSPDNASRFTTRETFLSYMHSLGLPVPEVHQVRSRDELHKVLNKSLGRRKYLLHAPKEPNHCRARTPLPRRTLSQTYNLVSRIDISQSSPWRLEQDTGELEKYSTFGIIVHGQVKAFAASFSTADSSIHLLDPQSALSQSMLRFVSSFAESQGSGFSIHLGIDFCVEDWVTVTGVVKTILPVEISNQAHKNTLLFQGMSGSVQLTRAYLACLQPVGSLGKKEEGLTSLHPHHDALEDPFMPESKIVSVYNFGELVSRLAVGPLTGLLTLRNTPKAFSRNLVLLVNRLFLWTDDSYSINDPVPFWWHYQVYVPFGIIKNIVRGQLASCRLDG
ncbi:uncharacterized protein A1O9_06352 [Exophiala aquamarina CBS 119918]|uniref:Uncharacterized protein n=1 Tax=Exophiala aquamarina CBS 119918 TaxID=1182545 RepID=A0A072PEX2_9EURO|nr:uncharacterized protein A1O9_06352 [Exophiala aquamarina CBS 119918]KEF58426.1 hypothetical protein A1O9_06352 [Exophiala aquamarina CBS 119918]